jgi:pimeloyl-ACP methyl ester carboxylesterase
MATFDHDGITTFYEQHGDGGAPLLCIMGLGCDHSLWEFQTPALARAHRVVVFDNRGVGRSSKPRGPYTVSLLADDAAALLDHLRIERAHVLGLSMGGMIAQRLALAHPSRVGALVLAATYARPDAGDADITRDGAAAGVPFTAMMRGDFDLSAIDLKQVFRFMMSLVLSPEYLAAHKPWLRALYDRMLATGASMEGFAAQVAAVFHHDASAALPSLRAPTLILTGDADRLVAPRHSDELARLIPHAKLVRIAGGTHGFNIEMPDRFNKEVLDFLVEHPLLG